MNFRDFDTFVFDLDGTICIDDVWQGPEHIGMPIPSMIMRMKRLIRRGTIVKIFTARMGRPGNVVGPIQDWLEEQGLPRLEVTNVKDPDCVLIYDDKARQVLHNTGKVVNA